MRYTFATLSCTLLLGCATPQYQPRPAQQQYSAPNNQPTEPTEDTNNTEPTNTAKETKTPENIPSPRTLTLPPPDPTKTLEDILFLAAGTTLAIASALAQYKERPTRNP